MVSETSQIISAFHGKNWTLTKSRQHLSLWIGD